MLRRDLISTKIQPDLWAFVGGYRAQEWIQGADRWRHGESFARSLVTARDHVVSQSDAIAKRRLFSLDERDTHARVRVAGRVRRFHRRDFAEEWHDPLHTSRRPSIIASVVSKKSSSRFWRNTTWNTTRSTCGDERRHSRASEVEWFQACLRHAVPFMRTRTRRSKRRAIVRRSLRDLLRWQYVNEATYAGIIRDNQTENRNPVLRLLLNSNRGKRAQRSKRSRRDHRK